MRKVPYGKPHITLKRGGGRQEASSSRGRKAGS